MPLRREFILFYSYFLLQNSSLGSKIFIDVKKLLTYNFRALKHDIFVRRYWKQVPDEPAISQQQIGLWRHTYRKCGLPRPLVLMDYCWFLRRKGLSDYISITWCWRRLLQWFFPHIVATEPSRSLRINPSMWMLLSKHRSSKLSKQVMNLPCVVKLARCVLTNLLQCNEMPARWFEVLLHPWTTQRIFYLKISDNRLNKRKSAKMLSSNAAFQFICMKITIRVFPLQVWRHFRCLPQA